MTYEKFVVGYIENNHPQQNKPKFTIEEQIEHMKARGIQFNVCSEEKAKEYLRFNTYFFKLKAYAKLFDKYEKTEKNNTYINLDFAYLCDLATIDCYLRKEIISISLDIEHYLKVRLLDDFNSSNEDGYKIIQDFIKNNPEHFENDIKNKKYGKACSNLIQKYESNWSIWTFIEILNFGDFAELYKFFYSRNTQFKSSKQLSYFINPVRILRNAAAHNNCLLQTIKHPYVSKDDFNYNFTVNSFLGKNGIKNKTLNKNMEKPLLHDLSVMLYLYHSLVPHRTQIHTLKRLHNIIKERFSLHKEYYTNNLLLISAYKFLLSVVEVFIKKIEKND